jgi:hypothetical protein
MPSSRTTKAPPWCGRAPARDEAQRYAARWILVRPDHFIAWTSQDAEITYDLALRVLALASTCVTQDIPGDDRTPSNSLETQ